jgi:hypothetical protein
MAAYAVRELGLDVRATTLESFGTGDQFDAVAMLQVVDDVEDIRLSFEGSVALRTLSPKTRFRAPMGSLFHKGFRFTDTSVFW